MVRRLIDLSLNNRFLVLALWGLLVVAGAISLRTLAIDAVPDVTNVQVQVLTNSPGLAPEEVERFITFPVEAAMSGLPRVEDIRSTSRFGLSVVTIVFEEGSDIYWARQLVGDPCRGRHQVAGQAGYPGAAAQSRAPGLVGIGAQHDPGPPVGRCGVGADDLFVQCDDARRRLAIPRRR